ncbi:MAG: hypothetical protein IKX26_00200 [Bacteroidales bacterium]|nr:hypothetical protein [Bacteroidales bacterium]MBR5399195.1 hypothetical protein [Bacteroidales bacterium]
MEEVKTIKEGFVGEIKGIIDKAREGAVRSVNFSRVIMYWDKVFQTILLTLAKWSE